MSTEAKSSLTVPLTTVTAIEVFVRLRLMRTLLKETTELLTKVPGAEVEVRSLGGVQARLKLIAHSLEEVGQFKITEG